MNKFIFSDVDGCIITDDAFDVKMVKNLIQQLHQQGFHLILATAKTAHEVVHLNETLDLPGPFIVENGGGILFRTPLSINIPAKALLAIENYRLYTWRNDKPNAQRLMALCGNYCRLLSHMHATTLSKLTHLTPEQAILAKTRYFTEPIYIHELTPPQLKYLKHILHQAGLYYIQTRKFLHVTTDKHLHKGSAIKFLLTNCYNDKPFVSYAIGDGLNDFSMLRSCDYPFLVKEQSEHHEIPTVDHWSTAIHLILNQTLHVL